MAALPTEWPWPRVESQEIFPTESVLLILHWCVWRSMQISVPLPDLLGAQLPRRESQAVSPTSPVPGVEAIAESLDPRIALQWTQPVLAGQEGDATRSALTQQTSQRTTALPPPASPEPAPTSGLQWSQTPAVLQALLSRVMSQDPQAELRWPEAMSAAPSQRPEALTDEPASLVSQALQRHYDALKGSELFAAFHLAQHWFRKSTSDAPTENATPASSELVSRWVEALAPDSEPARQVAQALMSGRMSWQGELIPGLWVQLQREDAWREDPARPGSAEKGAALHVQMELPCLGRVHVTAYQWGAHLELSVLFSAQGQLQLESAWPQLQERLATMSLGDVRTQWRVAT